MNFGKTAKSLFKAALIVLIAVIINANYRPIQEQIHKGIYWLNDINETAADAVYEVNRVVFNGTEFDSERFTKRAIYSGYESVVMISTTSTLPGVTLGGLGTGFFIKTDNNSGWIITNHHVIAEAVNNPSLWKVSVNTAMHMWEYSAEIVGVDEIADIAVLKITKQDNEEWEALAWEDNDKIGVGMPITVVGHGMSLAWTATAGIVSYAGRYGSRPYSAMVQIDAVINRGNSGGPVIGSNGKVVGVAQSLLSPGRPIPGWDGVGMAISAGQAERAFDYIMSSEYKEKGYVPYAESPLSLGTLKFADVKDINTEDRHYAYIDYSNQTDNSTKTVGEESGLQQGDIVLEVNGENVRTSWSVLSKTILALPGEEWIIKVRRNNKDVDVTVVLREIDRTQLLMALAIPGSGK
jgi:S1-C subfamily serine protease